MLNVGYIDFNGARFNFICPLLECEKAGIVKNLLTY